MQQIRPDLYVQRSSFSPIYTIVGVLVVTAFFTGVPWFLTASWESTLSNFFILLIMATMWNLLAGYAGMISIGQQAFVGLGAYATLYFALKGLNPFVSIPVAMAVCAVIAWPVTFLIFRLRGGYFAIATWVIASSAMLLIGTFPYLGGGTGLYLPGLSNLSPSALTRDTYLATWFAALVVSVGGYIILRSRLGLVLSSMRDNETASRSSGSKVLATRRLIFVIAAAGCGAAGAVLTISQPFVQPNNVFNLQWAAEMLFATMIGGLGTIEGPILGCAIFFVLQQSLQNLGAWYLIIFGAIAIAVAIWQPRGLWGAVRDRFNFELVPVAFRVSNGRPVRQRRRDRAPDPPSSVAVTEPEIHPAT